MLKSTAAGLVWASFWAGLAAAEVMPRLPVETLAGESLVVPDEAAPAALFVVGFSKASRAQTAEWSRRLDREDPGRPALRTYEVAVLEDVPKLLRRFVVGQIRSGVPQRLHPRFLLVLEQAGTWKRLAGYADPDAAYDEMIAKGRVEGRSEGRAEGAREVVLRLLGRRFGPLPEEVRRRVEAISSPETLARLADRVLAAGSLEEMGLA